MRVRGKETGSRSAAKWALPAQFFNRELERARC